MSKLVTQSLATLKETLKTNTENLSALSQKCISLKQSIWEAEAQKRFLLQKLEDNKSPYTSEVFLSELKSKYDRCKGTCIEKVLSSLIKAYQLYKKQSSQLSIQNNEKEDLLLTYQQITQNLSQESNLKQKLQSIQESLYNKQKTTDDFKSKLESLRLNSSQLKDNLDSGEVKKLLEERIQLKNDLEKCLEDQSILNIEIEKMNQLIETEKCVNCVTPDAANKVLKVRIKEVENQVAEIVHRIRNREKVRDKARVQLEKAGGFKKFNHSVSMEMSKFKIGTPKGMSDRKVLAFTPSCKSISRSEVKGVSSTGKGTVDGQGESGFGGRNQSYTSKIVMMNRGKFFK